MKALNLRFTISPQVIFQEVQLGESLLLDTSTLAYFAFDPLGTRIWQVMQETADADQVVQRVALESSLQMDVLLRQVQDILSGLQRSGLIALEKTKQMPVPVDNFCPQKDNSQPL